MTQREALAQILEICSQHQSGLCNSDIAMEAIKATFRELADSKEAK